MTKRTSVLIRMPVELYDEMNRVVDAHDVSMTHLMRQWIKLGLLIDEAGNEFILPTPNGEKHVRVLG